jgi:hypothetical protein
MNGMNWRWMNISAAWRILCKHELVCRHVVPSAPEGAASTGLQGREEILRQGHFMAAFTKARQRLLLVISPSASSLGKRPALSTDVSWFSPVRPCVPRDATSHSYDNTRLKCSWGGGQF